MHSTTYLQRVLLLFIPYLLIACTSQYAGQVTDEALTTIRFSESYTVSRSAEWVLNSKTHLYLARGAGSYSSEITTMLPRTNANLYKALAHALSQTFPLLEIAYEGQTLASAIEHARSINAQVLMYPDVVSLKNELSSVRELSEGGTVHPGTTAATDKLVFKVTLIDVQSGKIIDVALVQSRSRLFSLNEDTPIYLLDEAAVAYAKNISGLNASI